jgi:hypothetical protein
MARSGEASETKVIGREDVWPYRLSGSTLRLGT